MLSKTRDNLSNRPAPNKTSKFSSVNLDDDARLFNCAQNSFNKANATKHKKESIKGKVRAKLSDGDKSSMQVEKLSRSVFIGTFITVGSVIFAIVSIFTSQSAVLQATGDAREVLVATQQIAAGTTITKEMLETKNIPGAYVQSEYASDANEIIGKTAAMAISANSQISEYQISTQANTSSLAAKIPKGSKAISVNVTSSNGVSNLLKCGDRVNVYSANASSASMKKITENVLVLALDGLLSGPSGDVVYSTVTLQVTEQQSEEIIDAQTSDEIFLTLNSLADSHAQSNKNLDAQATKNTLNSTVNL